MLSERRLNLPQRLRKVNTSRHHSQNCIPSKCKELLVQSKLQKGKVNYNPFITATSIIVVNLCNAFSKKTIGYTSASTNRNPPIQNISETVINKVKRKTKNIDSYQKNCPNSNKSTVLRFNSIEQVAMKVCCIERIKQRNREHIDFDPSYPLGTMKSVLKAMKAKENRQLILYFDMFEKVTVDAESIQHR